MGRACLAYWPDFYALTLSWGNICTGVKEMSLYLTVHKWSFFLFGAIKFVLAEGGSACGCGRVYVKEWDRLYNHTSHLGQKVSGTKCSVNCLKSEKLGLNSVGVGLLVTKVFHQPEIGSLFWGCSSGSQGEECHQPPLLPKKHQSGNWEVSMSYKDGRGGLRGGCLSMVNPNHWVSSFLLNQLLLGIQHSDWKLGLMLAFQLITTFPICCHGLFCFLVQRLFLLADHLCREKLVSCQPMLCKVGSG